MRISLRHPSVPSPPAHRFLLRAHEHDLLFIATRAESVSQSECIRGCDRAPPNTFFTSHFPFFMLTNPFWIWCVCLCVYSLKLLVGSNLINPLFANERLPHQQHRTLIQETEDPPSEREKERKKRQKARPNERMNEHTNELWRAKFKSTSASVTKWFIRQTNIQHAYKLISLICLPLPLPKR